MLDTNMKRKISQKVTELNKRLSADESHIVDVYNRYRALEGNDEKRNIASLHATLGAHNNDFADVKHTTFSNVEDYLTKWLQGLERFYGDQTDPNTGERTYIIIKLLKDSKCKEYILNFQRRTFFKNYEAYTRAKPMELLETVWFGDNSDCWGLPITPVSRNDKYVNDHSEIRKVPFSYWTVEHILSTGLINRTSSEQIKFHRLGDLIVFLQKFPQRSRSPHEDRFLCKYLQYLKRSGDPTKEPLLIPEFRYGECDICHKWRTDYLILNSYVNNYVAIELSPKSTHNNWEEEMRKRNDYLKKYNISIITFTDIDLQSMDSCFEQVLPYLQKREMKKETIETVISRLNQS